ncbi:MAG: hypothetical protein ACOZIN_11520 [Myxococcota bacterium]
MHPFLLIGIFAATAALADAGVDASLPAPDASVVGEGGADRDNPEGDDSTGRTPTICRASKDCERGFVCEEGRCRYVGFTQAKGCGAAGVLWLSALAFVYRLRRPTEQSGCA